MPDYWASTAEVFYLGGGGRGENLLFLDDEVGGCMAVGEGHATD